MQLPRTLSPAFCCLLALTVQHVAGLVVPRGAPGTGAEASLDGGKSRPRQAGEGAGAGSRLTGDQAQRRQLDPILASIAIAGAEAEAIIGTRLSEGK